MFMQFCKHALEILLFSVAISGIITIGGELTISQHFSDLALLIANTKSERDGRNRDIRQINRLLAQADILHKHAVSWTPILIKIARAVPAGITLKTLSMQKESSSVSIYGEADAREDLLVFQKQLESAPDIGAVIIPLSELAAREHITFTLTANLK